MSDDTTATTETVEQDTPALSWDAIGEQFGFTPEQVIDKITHARKWEKRAKENSDAAERLAQIEEAQKTTEERLAEQVAAAQRDAESARAEALRFRVATRYGISDEDAELYLTATDEELLERQARGLAERAATNAPIPAPRPDLSQGAKENDLALNGDPLLRDLKSKLGIT